MEELVIDESNFDQYFFDSRKNDLKKGQVIACFSCKAEILAGKDKDRLIDILLTPGAGVAASQFMKKIFSSTEKDSILVPINILNDFKLGRSRQWVLENPYSYTVQMIYYTEREYVPTDDPHWSIIEIINNNIVNND